jgi:hypothetical protein
MASVGCSAPDWEFEVGLSCTCNCNSRDLIRPLPVSRKRLSFYVHATNFYFQFPRSISPFSKKPWLWCKPVHDAQGIDLVRDGLTCESTQNSSAKQLFHPSEFFCVSASALAGVNRQVYEGGVGCGTELSSCRGDIA